MYFIAISLVIGVLVGLFSQKAAGLMISVRTSSETEHYLVKKQTTAAWMIFLGLLFANIAIFYRGNPLKGVELMLWATALVIISAVDYVTRKIPNELLLLLFVSKIAFVPLYGAKWDYLGDAFGFIAALVLFMLPSMLKIGRDIGFGDVKFAAVLGFMFGAKLFLQIILVMSVSMGLYAIYLYLSKSGNLKTKVPVGPFLALGAIITGLFPIISNI